MKFEIQDKEIKFLRLRLRDWSKLEGVKQELDTATSKHDIPSVFQCMVKFVEVAVSPSPSNINWEQVPWYEFLEIYNCAIEVNSPKLEFPILRGSGADAKKQPWEYTGRSWYFWLNTFAKNYGWPEEAIANLDIDDALGLYQELQLDDQLQKEWEWGLSEIAYPYEEFSKKQVYKPLQRPSWMMPMIPKQLPVVKMLKAHIPMGNVIDVQEVEKERLAKRGTKNT